MNSSICSGCNGDWDDLPLDIQESIMRMLYYDDDRAMICDKRLVCKSFRDNLMNVQVMYGNADRVLRLLRIQDEKAYLDSLVWLEEKCEFLEVIMYHITMDVCSKGFTNVLIWLNDRFEDSVGGQLMDFAAIGGHIDTLNWLKENKPESYSNKLLPLSFRSKKMDVVQWVFENVECACDRVFDLDELIDEIVKNCDANGMKHLMSLRPNWRKLCIQESAILDRLDLLQCLYEGIDAHTIGFDEHAFECICELFCSKEVLEFIYERHFRENADVICRGYKRCKFAYDINNVWEWLRENKEKEIRTLSWLSSLYHCTNVQYQKF